MLTEIASTALEDGALIVVSNGSLDGDGGGGTFVWNPKGAAPGDGGIVFVPQDRAMQAANVTMFTGDGTTTTFSGTLPPYSGITYNSVKVLSGANPVASDTIAGTLMGAQVTAVMTASTAPSTSGALLVGLQGSGVSGTINYVTGAWTMTFSTAPPAGAPYKAAYVYASATGRWVRQYSGGVDIRWFGAIADGQTDMVPRWAATDYYCSLHGAAVYIPSPSSGSNTGWQVKTPMIVAAAHTYGDGSGADSTSGTRLNVRFATAQPDFAPGVTVINAFVFEQIDIVGHDLVPTPPNLLSAGAILTQASFQATFAATIMTVGSVSSGTIVVGGSVSAAGMTPSALGQCTVLSQSSGTPGGAGVYVVSISQPTISTAVFTTQTLLPTLAAFAKGTVGLNCMAQGIVRDCAFGGSKASIMLTSGGGHVYLDHVEVQGLIGVYCQVDKGDYSQIDCNFVGTAFAGMVIGLGGMGFRAYRVHYGYSPFGLFQINDGQSGNESAPAEYYGCSFEGFGEALEQLLPNVSISRLFLGNIGSSFYSQYSLPSTLLPTPGTYLFQWLGSLNAFTCSHNGAWCTSSGSNTPLGYAVIGSVNPWSGNDIDLSTFQGFYTIKNKYPGLLNADYSNPRTEQSFQRVSEKMMLSGFAQTPNLLLDPEQISNYKNLSAGTSISIVSLSSIGVAATDPELRLVLEESGLSSNPNVIVFSNATGGVMATLNVHSLAVFSPVRSINFHAWVLCNPGTMGVNLAITSDGTGAGTGRYARQATAPAFYRFKYEGSTPTDWAGTRATSLVISTNAAGTLYLLAPMLSLDSLAAYNRNPCPTALGPVTRQAVPYASLPPATLFTAGYTELFCSDGRKAGEPAGGGKGVSVYTVAGQNTWNVVGTNTPVTI